MLLDEDRHDRKNHHYGNDQRSRIFSTVDEFVNNAGAALARDLVWAEAPEPRGSLGAVEPRVGSIEAAERSRWLASARGEKFLREGDRRTSYRVAGRTPTSKTAACRRFGRSLHLMRPASHRLDFV
jgi:hypothetical protein